MIDSVKTTHCLAVLPLLFACRRNHPAEGPMQRAGAGVDNAAQATGHALSGAARKTGAALNKAGHATGHAAQKTGQKLGVRGSDPGGE